MDAYGTQVIDPDPGVRGHNDICIFASSSATHNTTSLVYSLYSAHINKLDNPNDTVHDVKEKERKREKRRKIRIE